MANSNLATLKIYTDDVEYTLNVSKEFVLSPTISNLDLVPNIIIVDLF